MPWLKKNSYMESDSGKKFLRLKSSLPLPSPPPHNFSNGLSLNIFHETMSNLFNLLIQRVQTVGRQRDKQ